MDNNFIYICYQSADEATLLEGYCTNILGVCNYEELAQEMCCNSGDGYRVFDLNTNYGRVYRSDKMNAVWNQDGKFIDYEGNDRTLDR